MGMGETTLEVRRWRDTQAVETAEQTALDRHIALLKAAAGPGVVNVTDQDLDALAEVLRG